MSTIEVDAAEWTALRAEIDTIKKQLEAHQFERAIFEAAVAAGVERELQKRQQPPHAPRQRHPRPTYLRAVDRA